MVFLCGYQNNYVQIGGMMEIKDSLTIYNELKASGVQEEQAQMQGKQLGGVYDVVKKLDKDMFWMRIIGAAIVAAILSNIVWK